MRSDNLQSEASSLQENTSTSDAQLLGSTKWEQTGHPLTDVLKEAWTKGIYLQSDFFRANSFYVALAASEGFITTKGLNGTYWNRWLITPTGLEHLWHQPQESPF